MQENTTTTNVVVVVHNNQIVGGLNLGRALTDGDWIGQEIDHTQTHNKKEEEATTDEVCGVGGQGDERPCNNQPHWAGQDIEGGERRWRRDGMEWTMQQQIQKQHLMGGVNFCWIDRKKYLP